MYDPVTLERLAEDRAALATVRVRSAVPWQRWGFSSVWLIVLATGIVWPWSRRKP
jgi:hypothetical protein